MSIWSLLVIDYSNPFLVPFNKEVSHCEQAFTEGFCCSFPLPQVVALL